MDFNQLYSLHGHHVFYTAKSFLGNREDAEDAVQDTFLEAYESMDTYNDAYAVSTWLNRICKNKCRDKLRRRKLEKSKFVPATDGNEHLLDSQEDFTTPEQVMVVEQDSNAILNSFLQMSSNIRTALTLFLVENYSYKEIAEKMGSPEGSVKTWVRRGRSLLSHTIGPH